MEAVDEYIRKNLTDMEKNHVTEKDLHFVMYGYDMHLNIKKPIKPLFTVNLPDGLDIETLSMLRDKHDKN